VGGDSRCSLVRGLTRRRPLAAHDLIDEDPFFVIPVVLGSGKQFLDALPDRVNLTLHDMHVSGWGVVTHYYTPTGAMP
jgi:dihydrofolate reductase